MNASSQKIDIVYHSVRKDAIPSLRGGTRRFLSPTAPLFCADRKVERKEPQGGGAEKSALPLAVPEKIIGLTLILDFFDRCDSFASLYPPPAALGSLAPLTPTLGCGGSLLKNVIE